MNAKKISNNAGTTLVELMVYMIVGLIVITSAFRIISKAASGYVHGRTVSKAQFGARDGVSAIARDIASMGYKMHFIQNNDGRTVMDTDIFGSTNYQIVVGTKGSVNRWQEDGNKAAFFFYPMGGTGGESGDTLEFFRIRVNDDGRRIARERVIYTLDTENNNIVREFYIHPKPGGTFNFSSFNDWGDPETTIIASNVAALKFRFSRTGRAEDWVSQLGTTGPNPLSRDNVRNIEVSMLVRSPRRGDGNFAATSYTVGDYEYKPNEENFIYRLYQQAVEVPNNARGVGN
jgi:hypothetical protein